MTTPKSPEFLATLEAMIDDPALPPLDGLIPALVQRLSPSKLMLGHDTDGWNCLIISGASSGTQHADLREAVRIEVRRYCEAHEKVAGHTAQTQEANLAYDRAFDEARKYAPTPSSARALLHLVAVSHDPHRFRAKDKDQPGRFCFPIYPQAYTGSYVVLSGRKAAHDPPTVADLACAHKVTLASLEILSRAERITLRLHESESLVRTRYHAEVHQDILDHFLPLLQIQPPAASPPATSGDAP